MSQFGSRSDLVEDVAEPIVGWRAWDSTTGGCLESVYTHTRWPIEGIEAECKCVSLNNSVRRCLHPPGVVPYRALALGRGFGCGIYAMKTYDVLINSTWGRNHPIRGRVELGGRVQEHQYGYRAQLARVTGLILPPEKTDDPFQVPSGCGCPACREFAAGRYQTKRVIVEKLAEIYGVPLITSVEEVEA